MENKELEISIKKIMSCTGYSKEKSADLLKDNGYNLEKTLESESRQIKINLITRYTEYDETKASEKMTEFGDDAKAILDEYNAIVRARFDLILSKTNFTPEIIKEKMKKYRNNSDKVLEDYQNEYNEKIQCIMRQTDYSEDVAKERLDERKGDHIGVIKSFMGLTEKKAPETVASLNQEIYKQIRYKMDTSMREYNERKEKVQEI